MVCLSLCSIRRIASTLSLLLARSAFSQTTAPADGAQAQAIVPAPRQIAWQELEFHAFVHFGMNTFTDREWGEGTEDPKLFNPTAFDAKQWVKVFKDAGMKQVILTCKHHDGFCLWPSKYTTHSVASSPWKDGKADVVREVREACREAGLKFGVYLSPWDRHEPCYGDSPKYNEHFKKQLTELLTTYGPVHEVWFDGACGEGPNGKKQEYDWPAFIEVVRKHAPDAVIFSDAGPDVRWVGNENGYAGETNWSMLRRAEFYPGTPNNKPLTEGHENGTHWLPAECDVSIRPGWFYHPAEDAKVKSLQELLDIYYKSVGRNAVLLLNVPADKRGLIHENDAARLRELRATLDETFKTNLAAARDTFASIQAGHAGPGPGQSAGSSASAAVDGDWRTSPEPLLSDGWRTGLPMTLKLDLPAAATFDRVVLQEDITHGQLVRLFRVLKWESDRWQPIAEGTTIGFKRIFRIPRTTAKSMCLEILDSRAMPRIGEFGLYLASPKEGEGP